MMQQNDPTVDALLSGQVLVISPHMDDEVLGCGGVMSLHRDKRRLHCIFATDGANSPLPLLPWQKSPGREICQVRENEAKAALAEIGLSEKNLIFAGFPDGRLGRHRCTLIQRLEGEIDRIRPDFILVPFRYDRHPDHIAVHRAVRKLKNMARTNARILEYFVYIRWRLIPGHDIRNTLSEERLVKVDVTAVAAQKISALKRYRSQTTIFYPWQDSPILTDESIRWRCAQPEVFLISEAEEGLLDCFTSKRYRIFIAHFAERIGKRRKDQLVALWRCLWRRLSGSRG